MFDIKRAAKSALQTHPEDELTPLFTPWGDALDPMHVLQEYPRPQLKRASYINLNGRWDYALCENTIGSDINFDTLSAHLAQALLRPPAQFDGHILVPFSPEAPLSGVQRTLQPHEVLWYRRTVSITPREATRCLLHFEAVDYACACFVNDMFVGAHVGGYTPFTCDITDALKTGETTTIMLAVVDPTNTGVQPRGKQRLDRGSIWYTGQSGIWQTVWMEFVPETYIESIHLVADPDSKQIELELTLLHANAAHDTAYATDTADTTDNADTTDSAAQRTQEVPSTNASCDPTSIPRVEIGVYDGEDLVFCGEVDAQACTQTSARPFVQVNADPEHVAPLQTTTTLRFAIPLENPHLWSPDDPHLYSLIITAGDDVIESYCAFRTFSIEKDTRGIARFCLNHQPFFLKGLLDQGYWPDGLMTAPSDEALIFDIQFARNHGFNMLRKHIKVECDRWYYHCDRLGVIVWQDMVCGGSELATFYTSKLPTIFPRLATRLNDTRRLDRFSAQSEAAQQAWLSDALATMVHLRNHPCIGTWVVFNEGWGQFHARAVTQRLSDVDNTRPFDQTSGWFDQGGGDFISEHNYFRDLRVPKPLNRHDERATVISEFGGLALHIANHSAIERAYGYTMFESNDAFKETLQAHLDQVDALEAEGLSGYVYTQISDIEEEVNGLMTYDRKVIKID